MKKMKIPSESINLNDGTRIQSANSSTEADFFKAGYRKYSGNSIDIFYNKEICKHVGNCVFSNPDIYEVGRRPWIIPDKADSKKNERVVGNCPSGALKYALK